MCLLIMAITIKNLLVVTLIRRFHSIRAPIGQVSVSTFFLIYNFKLKFSYLFIEWKCPIQNPLLPCYKLRGFYTPCHTDKDCLNFYSISKCCYSPCLRINVCQIAVPYAIKHPQTCCNTITSTTTNTPILLSTTTTEEPTEKSAEVSTEEPTEMATIQPTAEPTEKLIQETTEEPIEKTTQPIQQETEESTEPSEEETDEVTDEPTTVEPITTEPTSPQTTTVDIPTPA